MYVEGKSFCSSYLFFFLHSHSAMLQGWGFLCECVCEWIFPLCSPSNEKWMRTHLIVFVKQHASKSCLFLRVRPWLKRQQEFSLIMYFSSTKLFFSLLLLFKSYFYFSIWLWFVIFKTDLSSHWGILTYNNIRGSGGNQYYCVFAMCWVLRQHILQYTVILIFFFSTANCVHKEKQHLLNLIVSNSLFI